MGHRQGEGPDSGADRPPLDRSWIETEVEDIAGDGFLSISARVGQSARASARKDVRHTRMVA
jgi:hypothetical protein